jgi:uncharacterized protein YndB with AHSA1/START domain
MENKNENKTYDLKVEKTIAKTPSEVFRAIGEGRLFLNCGADQASMKIDFKVGGKYAIHFHSHGAKNGGEFLEIIPHQKIVFTWCQGFEADAKPDTTVSIELKDLGGKTALTLVHSGFSDIENKDNHQGGWTSGLNDVTEEITNGRLRMVRKISMGIEKAFAAFQSPKSNLAIHGKTLETVPNKKIVLSLEPETKLTLLFDTDDDDTHISWLEIIHEGLKTEAEQKSYRAKWDALLKGA